MALLVVFQLSMAGGKSLDCLKQGVVLLGKCLEGGDDHGDLVGSGRGGGLGQWLDRGREGDWRAGMGRGRRVALRTPSAGGSVGYHGGMVFVSLAVATV